jgi:multiple sugar transport system permease protein
MTALFMNRRSRTNIFKISLAAILTIIYIFPLYWMFSTSIKSPEEILHVPPIIVPEHPQIESYRQVLGLSTDRQPLTINTINLLMNSMIISTYTTVVTLLLAVPGAYALARFRIRGRSILEVGLLDAQMLPSVLLVIPLFVLFRPLGLINQYSGVILADAALALPMAIIILRASFLQIPVDLEEAALIDGGSRVQVLMYIVLPLIRAGLVAVGVFAFLTAWGEFVFALSFLQAPELHPVSIGVYQFIGMYTTQWDSMMAFASLIALPALVAFLFLQKYFIRGMTAGAVN